MNDKTHRAFKLYFLNSPRGVYYLNLSFKYKFIIHELFYFNKNPLLIPAIIITLWKSLY